MTAPKLRFKEFNGDWASLKIKDLVKSLDAGVSVNSEDLEPHKDEYSVLKTSCISSGYFDKKERKRVLQDEEIQRLKEPVLGDSILMSRMNTPLLVGMNAYVFKAPKNTFLPDRLWQLKINDNKTVTRWLAFYLGSDQGLNQIRDLASGTSNSMKNITKHDVLNIDLFTPQKEEQTKIASFLSAVDEKISQLTQKHALLSQYKQGMIQKLFSQQIRFKADDGSEFGAWEDKSLSNFIIKHIGGASLTPSDFVEQSEYEVIPKKAIVPNGYLNLDKDNPTYCSEDFFKANLKNTVDNAYLVTVLRDLVPSGPSIGYIVKFLENNQYILAQGVYGFKLKKELNKDFLIHFSNTKAYRLVMQSIMVGSTQVHIRNKDFFGIEIPVPCLEEQTKIANFLSAIDQKIAVVAQQIEQAKVWKKGLLQQMFV